MRKNDFLKGFFHRGRTNPIYFEPLFRGLVTGVVLFFLVLCLTFSYSKTVKKVSLESENESFQFNAAGEITTAKLLSKSGIILGLDDRISRGLNESLADGESIKVEFSANSQLSVPAASSINSITDITQLGTLVMTSSGSIYEYTQKTEVVATAYCSCAICCGPYDGNSTADGSVPAAGHTVAAPPTYAFGTKMYIPEFDYGGGSGIYEVEDRGGAITDNRIDIYFSTHEEALSFGRRRLTVYILK